MKQPLRFFDALSRDKAESFTIELPNLCPICKKAIHPDIITAYYSTSDIGERHYYVSYLCISCSKCFIAHYTTYKDYSIANLKPEFYPCNIEKAKFSDNIVTLSPEFTKIYNESFQAEQHGLNKICGMGYRKALEFLVKDYAKINEPNEADKINELSLSNCINEYINNEKIKHLAIASAWLGNDETHYERKHQDYDIHHLKAFIDALVYHIDFDFAVVAAEKFMDK